MLSRKLPIMENGEEYVKSTRMFVADEKEVL